MTNLSSKNNFCVGVGIGNVDKGAEAQYITHDGKFQDLNYFDKFLTNSISLVLLASKNNIELSLDCFFITGNLIPEPDISLLIGDFDKIVFDKTDISQKNINELNGTIYRFLIEFVNPINLNNYIKLLNKNFSQFGFIKPKNIKK